MSFYSRFGSFIVPVPENKNYFEGLPVGTYSIGIDQKLGYILSPITDYVIDTKIYGNPTQHCGRILNTFLDRPFSTGVLLSGEKGSGKTLLTKMISIEARRQGISTLIVNQQYCGEAFNLFIQSISEKCVIIFDEFEKVYDDKHQQELLTLFDGVSVTQKLFLVTSNERLRINRYMNNRPGRIFYVIEYSGLTAEFIREYCDDMLNAKEHIDTICRLASMFESFNFDMLKALVEDMNRYKETPHQTLKLLNAKPLFESRSPFDISVTYEGKPINKRFLYNSELHGNPISQENIQVIINNQKGNDHVILNLIPDNLREISNNGEVYHYESGKFSISFTKRYKSSYNYMEYIDGPKKDFLPPNVLEGHIEDEPTNDLRTIKALFTEHGTRNKNKESQISAVIDIANTDVKSFD